MLLAFRCWFNCTSQWTNCSLLRRWVTMISILFIQRTWNQLMMTTNHPLFIPNYTQSQWNRGETVVWRRVASFGVILPSSCRHNAPMIRVSTKQDHPNPPRSAALPPTSVVVPRECRRSTADSPCQQGGTVCDGLPEDVLRTITVLLRGHTVELHWLAAEGQIEQVRRTRADDGGCLVLFKMSAMSSRTFADRHARWRINTDTLRTRCALGRFTYGLWRMDVRHRPQYVRHSNPPRCDCSLIYLS